VLVAPNLVVALDPDSRSTALAWAVLEPGETYRFAGCEGGGSRAVTWQSVTGALAWLRAARAGRPIRVAVVVETQAPNGPASADCEPLRAVRYHWQAACEINGSACVFVDAPRWQRSFLRGEILGRGAGSIKRAYRRRAKQLTPLAINEDRCAAIGILSWYVVDVLQTSIDFDRA
jgi:hypothetical protein